MTAVIPNWIQKKTHGYGTTTLIISNEEMNDIMSIVQALENSNILLKVITKTIETETKEQKGGLLEMVTIRYFRSYFLRKYVNRKRNVESWLWK